MRRQCAQYGGPWAHVPACWRPRGARASFGSWRPRRVPDGGSGAYVSAAAWAQMRVEQSSLL